MISPAKTSENPGRAQWPNNYWLLTAPGVVAGMRCAQCRAHKPHRIAPALHIDESVSHGFSLAKNVVAFYIISRSCRSRIISRSSRRTSSSLAFIYPWPRKASSPAIPNSSRHRYSVLGCKPRSKATPAMVLLLCNRDGHVVLR